MAAIIISNILTNILDISIISPSSKSISHIRAGIANPPFHSRNTCETTQVLKLAIWMWEKTGKANKEGQKGGDLPWRCNAEERNRWVVAAWMIRA